MAEATGGREEGNGYRALGTEAGKWSPAGFSLSRGSKGAATRAAGQPETREGEAGLACTGHAHSCLHPL